MAWNRESKRHAKAAKGISTRKDTRSSMAQASSNSKMSNAMTSNIRTIPAPSFKKNKLPVQVAVVVPSTE